MKKLITLFAIAGLVLALAPTAQAAPITAPGDTYAGDYRIAFVSNGKRGAGPSTDTIVAYNAFVTAEAAAVTELDALGVEWKCIGSTETIDAKVNTSTHTTGDANDVPIYTTTGQLIATNNADLWDGNIQNPISYDDGTAIPLNTDNSNPAETWTGTDADGASASDTVNGGSYLGSGWAGDDTANYVRYVRGGYTDGGWISGVSNHDGYAGGSNPGGPAILYHFMALSGLLGLPPAGTVFIIQ